MDKAQLQNIIQSYRHYETRFFRDHAPDVSDGFLYGEIGFCLANLKPCVLIDFPDPLLDQYMTSVMTPWLTQWNGFLLSDGVNEWRMVKRNLSSPELPHAMPVIFFVHGTDSRLESSSTGRHLLVEGQGCERLDVVNESDLASILDYPGHLPRSLRDLDTMREVVYYDQESRLVLTTFAAQLNQQQDIQQHFEAYKNVMATLDIHLGLIFRRPFA